MVAATLNAFETVCQRKCKAGVVLGCADGMTVTGGHGSYPNPTETDTMNKIFSALILTAFAFSAQAASHAGCAPMKADAPMAAASGAHKAKKAHAAKPAKKAPIIASMPAS